MPLPEAEEKAVKGKRRKLRAESGEKSLAAPEIPAPVAPAAAPEKK
jgi:hypothetical protein